MELIEGDGEDDVYLVDFYFFFKIQTVQWFVIFRILDQKHYSRLPKDYQEVF